MNQPHLTRRALAAGALAAALPTPRAGAQSAWPDRSLRLIVPFPPGGPVDAVARQVAAAMAPHLNQQIIVESRSGAGGVVGLDALAKALPDGLTLALGSTGATAVNATLLPNLPYDPRRDIAAVGLVSAVPSLLVVRPGLAVQDLTGLLALARRDKGQVTYASTGQGGTPHLAAELFRLKAGLELVHVAYRGAAPAIVALLGNEVDMAFLDLSVLLPQVREGKLRPIALAAEARSPLLPQVPTLAELGLDGTAVENWYVLLAPARVPADRIAVLHAALRRATEDPALAERFTGQGLRVLGGTPEAAQRFIAAEIDRWGEVVRRADIRPD